MKRSLAALLISTAALAIWMPLATAQEAEPAPAAQASPGQQPAAGQDSAFRDIMTREYSQEALDLALQLVQKSGTSRTFDQLLPDIADQAKTNFIRANPQMQLGIIEVVDRVALDLVNRRPQLDQMLARVWASGFTEAEMQELVEFYDTEVGTKFADVLPQLLTVQMATAQIWSRAVLAELTRRVTTELRATMAAEQELLEGDTAGPAPAAPAAEAETPAAEADTPAAPDLSGALAPAQ